MIERVMDGVTRALGHPAMIPACAVAVGVMYWLTGVDIANISISIATLLALPLLQHSQTKDTAALQVKLDALIKSSDAPNEFAGIDRKTEAEIERLRDE